MNINKLNTQTTLFPMEVIPNEIQKLQQHGTPLSNEDLQDFSKAQYQIYQLMRDGAWHSATQIIETSGIRSGLRLMRTFREKGWQVNKSKSKKGSREWLYQLIK